MWSKKLLRLSIVVGLILAALLIWLAVHQQQFSAKIKISVTPAGSKLTINNREARESTVRLRPGTYKIQAKHDGFAEASEQITVAKGETKFVGLALSPNSAATANWYQTHPEDQQKLEGISGQNFDQTAEAQVKRLPLIKELPFVDQLYRVDYGRSVAHPDDPDVVAIYIKYYSDTGKQQALDWIRFKGYDPAKLEIIYQSASGF